MTAPPPSLPWWKSKRTWAAALALWLLVAYPLTTGPMQYAALRDWVPVDVYYIYCWVPMRGLNRPSHSG